MVVHCDYLRFGSDAIKEFLNIIAKSCTNIIGILLCILKEDDVVKCQVVNRFTFLVSCDVGWKSACSFQTIGHFVTDPSGEECLPVMVQDNGTTCERIAWFRDSDFSVIFCGLRQDAMDNAVVDEVLRSMCPRWGKSCQHI